MLRWVVVHGMCGRLCFCSHSRVVFVLICNLFLFIFSNEKLPFAGFIGSISSLAVKLIRLLPGGAKYLNKEQKKVMDKLTSGTKGKELWATELPKQGLGPQVIERMLEIKKQDKPWEGRCSGAVYIGGTETEGHFRLVNEAYCMFAHTNPLHPDVWPSIPRFESEVVNMTASFLGSKLQASGGMVCGNMTSGGTESILMAVKTTRDYMKASRGITAPEMIIAESAHSAYDKAAQYFQIKLRRAPVADDLRADVKAMKRLINKNTIMLVASSPGFPHGVIDPIEELSALALQYNICLHVDLCLGGFVLPFAKKLGYPIPPFDFRVAGVTSISVDVHKYGLGPKGTSVVLYRNHELRKYQFVAVTEWSGGLYVSPSMAGSRAGALIAAAWASMMSLGESGYTQITRKLMEAARNIKLGIPDIEGLYVLGKPDMTVVAFASKELNIYKVNEAMAEKGWSLNALHKPSSVHICVTLQHVDVVDKFLDDLKAAVKYVRDNPGKYEDGMAPIYGAGATLPDRGTIRDILVDYMDSTC
uniref:sphinganine-1-phosphate aldolase n=1 Tax=Physcomitrium patens TaxID=3218 RepID=A0A7I4CT04_PHYPA